MTPRNRTNHLMRKETTMILYHGSNVEVKEPVLLATQRELDFGKGFYTSSSLEQATRWAKRTASRLGQNSGFVTVYDLNDDDLRGLLVLKFDKPDVEWLHFVVNNRKGQSTPNEWDIICGPVANDQTASVIDFFVNGLYDEEETIKRLLPQKLKDQFTFKTEEALKCLKVTEVIPV